MLYVLQYLALIAAFALPWCIGGSVRFHKSGDRKKFMLCIAIGAISAIIITLTVVIAFSINN